MAEPTKPPDPGVPKSPDPGKPVQPIHQQKPGNPPSPLPSADKQGVVNIPAPASTATAPPPAPPKKKLPSPSEMKEKIKEGQIWKSIFRHKLDDTPRNRSLFLDRPLIPERLEGILPEYQYEPYTTEVTKALGRLVASFPGLKQAPVASPILVENFVRTWTGGAGMLILDLADRAARRAGVRSGGGSSTSAGTREGALRRCTIDMLSPFLPRSTSLMRLAVPRMARGPFA